MTPNHKREGAVIRTGTPDVSPAEPWQVPSGARTAGETPAVPVSKSAVMHLNFRTRLFLILFLTGMAGVTSFLLVDLSALVASVPVPAGSEIPTITPMIKVLSLIQPTVLLAAAILIGIVLGAKVGLSAPFAESLAAGEANFPVLRSQFTPGLLGGLVGALCIVLTATVSRPFLMPEIIGRSKKVGALIPIATRLLYGGITEELLLRWGFMTLLVWIAWRLVQKRLTKPTGICFVAAILLSSFVFGLGHLPITFLLIPEAGIPVVLFVIIANSAFGVVAGYLYWKYGLEAAMIAHMLVHVLLVVATYVGLYF